MNSKTNEPPYTKLFLMLGIVFLFDQLSKLWIVNNIDFDSYFYPQDSGVIEVIKGFFYIVHIGNKGAAWGIFSGQGGFLIIFTLIAFVAIYKFRHSLELHRKTVQIAFGMLIGGALGNLTDRILRGHVVDFLDFHFGFTIPWILPNGRYPAFNIADCGIVIGMLIYLFASFLESEKGGAAEP